MFANKILNPEKDLNFMGHLEELRGHIIRALIAVGVFTIGAFMVAPWIFENIVFAPARVDFPTFKFLCRLGNMVGSESLCIDEIAFKVQSRYMTGQFTMHVMSSFVIGLVVAFPYVIWELWRFIKPALYRSEQKNSRGAVAAISFLFLSGVLFGYYVLCPIMISFLANYEVSDMISNEFDITSYVGTIVGMVLGTGLLFQLPVLVYFFTALGMVSPMMLRKFRKHAVIAILVIGAVITPSADPLSQALISVPLYILYEISILISARVFNRKEKALALEKVNI